MSADPRDRRRMLAPRPGQYAAGGQVPDDVGLAIVRPLRPEVAAELAADPIPARPDPLAGAARLELSTEAWRDAAALGGPPADVDDDQADDVDEDLVGDVGTPGPSFDVYDVDEDQDDDQDGTVPEGPPVEPEDPADDVDDDDAYRFPQEVLRSEGPPAASSAGSLAVSGRGQGWASQHDPASLDYRVRQLMDGPVTLFDLVRPHGPVLDQGAEGACAGFAAAAVANVLELAAASVKGVAVDDRDLLASVDAFDLYEDAQDRDGYPNSSPGTSVLAVMKAGRDRGLWGSYVWAFGTRDVAQAVLQVGAVVLGLPWPVGDVGPDGVVQLEPNAAAAPVGHALACIGLVRELPEATRAFDGRPGPWFVVQNSWGPSWGAEGLGYLHHADLSLLLRSWGEAAVPLAVEL